MKWKLHKDKDATMEGFNMDDWYVYEELEDANGIPYKWLNYKHNEGLKSYTAWYWSPEEIWFEVWNDGDLVCGGLTWNEALNIEVVERGYESC